MQTKQNLKAGLDPQRAIALITGGGGKIAEAVAGNLDELGYGLILVDISQKSLARVAAQLTQIPILIQCDLSRPAEMQKLLARVESEYSAIQVLINCAGYIQPGELVDLRAEEIDKHLQVNLASVMQLTRGVAALMKARKRGHIITLISMGGIIALAGSACYSATKFGLRGFNHALHIELKPHNVQVCGVFPSAVDTPMLQHEIEHHGSALNFVGAVQNPEKVAQKVMLALRCNKVEIYVPYAGSLSARLLAACPGLFTRLYPLLEWIGKKGRQKYLQQCKRKLVHSTN
ncbi:MAG: SDR family NAD(P)-dependent oxidoreductase [bacterium]